MNLPSEMINIHQTINLLFCLVLELKWHKSVNLLSGVVLLIKMTQNDKFIVLYCFYCDMIMKIIYCFWQMVIRMFVLSIQNDEFTAINGKKYENQ